MHAPAFEFPLSTNVFIGILASYTGISEAAADLNPFWMTRLRSELFVTSAKELKEQVVRNMLFSFLQTR